MSAEFFPHLHEANDQEIEHTINRCCAALGGGAPIEAMEERLQDSDLSPDQRALCCIAADLMLSYKVNG